MKLVYLAGAMSCYGDDDYPKQWRLKVKNQLVHNNDNFGTEFVVFNPTLNSMENHDIITQNRYYIKGSDIVVVNLTDLDKSLGSIGEIMFAYEQGLPIIGLGTCIWDNHPYLNKILSARFKTIREMTDFIKDVYGQ